MRLTGPNFGVRIITEVESRLKRAEAQRQQNEISCEAYRDGAPDGLQDRYYQAAAKVESLKAQKLIALNRWRAENNLPQK